MSKIVMRCATPVMTAEGAQKYQPGDLLPVGHPDTEGWEWAEFIAADDVDFADTQDVEKPEPVVEPEPVPPAKSEPVDF